MNRKIIALALLFTACSPAYAVWRNSGTWTFTDSKMDVPEFENNGKFISRGKSNLNLDKLTGNGLIHVMAGVLTIRAREFNFNGTINCEQNSECVVHTATPKSDIKATKEGVGTLAIHPLATPASNS
jgi:hypothetical protein